MIDNIIVFEDDLVDNFQPLLHTRAVFELKYGMYTFLERLHLFYPSSKYSLWVRDYLKQTVTMCYPRYFVNTPNVGLKALIVNGRLVYSRDLFELVNDLEEENLVVVKDNQVAALVLENEYLQEFVRIFKPVNFSSEEIIKHYRKNPDIKIINLSELELTENIWGLISKQGEILRSDFALANKGGIIKGKMNAQSYITNEDYVFIGENTKISPFVHIDATEGPVYIGNNVTVKSQVLIEGPVCIDDNAIIYPGYIRKNTFIGENCRVGGEVEGSIFLANSNKYHAGFVGHSYVGEWVNFGAMSTTSDLKNNYSEIDLVSENRRIKTGQRFLGSIIADHVKLGIGTLLTTGTIIGFGANYFGAQRVSGKWIPSFSWGSSDKMETYKVEKFLETAQIVMKRRGRELNLPERSLLELVFQQTSNERSYFS